MNVTPEVSVDVAITSDLVDNVGGSYAVDSGSERKRAASTNSPLPHPRRLQTLDAHEDEVGCLSDVRVGFRTDLSVRLSFCDHNE